MSQTVEQFRDFFYQRMARGGQGHFAALGFSNPQLEKGWARLEMPYQDHLVGNPATGVIAGGAMSALLDTCCALAAATAQDPISFCPTLDLRLDHLGVAEPHQPLIAEAHVYRATRAVIFTQGIIYQGDRDKPVVRAQVNFTPIEHTIVNTTDFEPEAQDGKL